MPLFGGSGGDEDSPANKEGKENKKEGKKEGKDSDSESSDPFSNFDFTRFRSSRPSGNTPENSSSNEKPPEKETTEETETEDELPPRRRYGGTRSGGGGFGGGFNNFGGNQFGGFGGQTQIPQLNFPRPGRGSIILLIVAVIIIALIILVPTLLNFWTDLLWFQEVGQTGVFWTRILQPLLVFAIAFVIAFAVIMANVAVARRFGPTGPVITSNADNPLSVLLGGGVRFLNALFIVASIVISLFLAGAASGNWQTILFYLNAAPWTEKETIFNRQIGFYVFDAPFFSFLQGWLVGLFIVALIASLAIYMLRFTLSGRSFTLTRPIKTHASIMGAIILGLFALGYQISNWNLVYSTRGRVQGASATDVGAQEPANNILTFLVAAAALLLIVNIFIRDNRRGATFLVAAAAIWLVGHIVIGGVYPSLYQNFTVKPNEITKEHDYIQNTIAMTRKAFGLDATSDLKVVPFQGTAQLTQQEIQQNPYIQQNARLWDYDKLRGIYDITQTLRRYYEFTDIDIDRYNLALNGGTPSKTQVMLSARELNLDQLTTQTWQSLHLQYTHGYGIQASPVNQVDSSGRPINLITQSFPFNSSILPVSQPRIYFGERPSQSGANYSVVGTTVGEIDYPFQEQGQGEATFRYDGKGGIQLSNVLIKAAFALRLGDFNLLISDAVNDNSRLIFRRTISERVNEIAPFLTYDSDPYIVAADGRLYWIQDAYTKTDLYPHSDSVGDRRTQGAFNYIRNSVKVVIDAYDGTTTFYLMNIPNVDPIAQTYANIYPNLFKPYAQMPQSLKDHLRYPEYLFQVQTQVYTVYHVTDPNAFYNNQDIWQIPNDPRKQGNAPYDPFYLVTRLPGETTNEFVLINVFQPQNRNNLVSWMAGRMDGPNYGKLVVYNFDPAVNIDGPAQFYSKIQALPDFSRQQALYNSGSSSLPPGPIIIIPVDNSLLYVLPYYLQSSTTALPQLQFISVGANGKVYLSQPGPDDDRTKLLPTALSEVFTQGQQVAVTPGQSGQPTTPGAQTSPVANASPPPASTPSATLPGTTPGAAPASGPTVGSNQSASVAELVRSIKAHQDLAAQAFAAGDSTRGNAELNAANNDLARLNQLLGR